MIHITKDRVKANPKAFLLIPFYFLTFFLIRSKKKELKVVNQKICLKVTEKLTCSKLITGVSHLKCCLHVNPV